MITLYNEILYRPLLNSLIFIYNFYPVAGIGLSVIILTIIIRIILFPLFQKSSKNQIILQKIQPEIKETTTKYKDNKEEQVKQILSIYKKHKVNPFSSIVILFIQIPILLALFHVFFYGLNADTAQYVYNFISFPDNINFSLFGLINLQEKSILMVVLASIAQYFQGKVSLPKLKNTGQPLSMAEDIGRKMVTMSPIITFVILINLPAVLSVYWITTSLFSIFQQISINRSLSQYKS